MLHEQLARLFPNPCQTIRDALRQHLLKNFEHAEHRKGSLLCGLEHDRIAGRQRGADLRGRLHQRRVPRDNGAHDAHGFSPAVLEDARRRRNGLSLQFAREPRKEAQNIDHRRRFAPRLGRQRIAGLQRGQTSQALPFLGEPIRGFRQKRAAITSRPLRPIPPCRMRGRHYRIDILAAASRHDSDRFRFGGVFDFDGLVSQGPAKLAIRHDLSGNALRLGPRRGGALGRQSAGRSSFGLGLRVIQHHALPDWVCVDTRTPRVRFRRSPLAGGVPAPTLVSIDMIHRNRCM